MLKPITAAIAMLMATGCAHQTNWDINRQTSAAPTIALSPIDDQLACVKGFKPEESTAVPRIAVDTITNTTGIYDFEGQGNYLQTEVGNTFVTAFKKAGLRVVMRDPGSVRVMEWEMNLAAKGLISDERFYTMGSRLNKQTGEVEILQQAYRPLKTGTVLGSNYALRGSINRLDFDTSSSGMEINIDGFGVGRRSYNALVGMDISLIDTQTGEVVWAEQYNKQYFGVESKGGVFRLQGGGTGSVDLIDVNFGVQTNDPVMAGVTDMVMYAAFDIAQDIYQVTGRCDVETSEPEVTEESP